MKLVVSVGLWSQAQTSTKFSNFISSDSSANQSTKWLAAVDEFNQIYVWKFVLADKDGFLRILLGNNFNNIFDFLHK